MMAEKKEGGAKKRPRATSTRKDAPAAPKPRKPRAKVGDVAAEPAASETPGVARKTPRRSARAASTPAPSAQVAGRRSPARTGTKTGLGQGATARSRRRAAPETSRAPLTAASEDTIPVALAELTEEERIESAKYEPRGARRVFEEERFVFPESYGVNRVRILVKDPEWLFVYWDVDPGSLDALRAEVGERALAVSKFTLRVADAVNGGMNVILLPPGARSWYVRADAARRAYRAEVGMTLPSGEFRCLADSNTVVTPRVGPSPERARRVLLYSQAQSISSEAGLEVGAEELRSAAGNVAPWNPASESSGGGQAVGGARRTIGGASDSFRPGGASDVHRR
jgi:hypothetical protein